jgi:hypothetical protein
LVDSDGWRDAWGDGKGAPIMNLLDWVQIAFSLVVMLIGLYIALRPRRGVLWHFGGSAFCVEPSGARWVIPVTGYIARQSKGRTHSGGALLRRLLL